MKRKTVILIIVIIGLLIIGGIAVFLYINSNNSKQTNEEEKSSNSISQIDKINEEMTNKKLDVEKDIVYNAQYMYNIEQKVYKNPDGVEYSIFDIVVPYININSESARELNAKIEQLYFQLAENFRQNLETDNTSYVKSEYRIYINSDILSILIIVTNGNIDEEIETYFAYNIDLSTLEILSYEDIYQQCGFTNIDIDNNIKDTIQIHFNNIDDWPDNEDKSVYINTSIENYQNAVNNNTIQYFIDLNRKLNVVVAIQIPTGIYNKILIVE